MSTVLRNERILANRSVPDEITPGDNTIDSRDVIERIEYLTEERGMVEKEDLSEWQHSDDATELRLLQALAEENISEWDDGALLVNESYFETYAQDMADEIGDDKLDVWPYTCIDWKKAARELQVDYTSVQFGDVTYYVR